MIEILPCPVNLKFAFHGLAVAIVARLQILMREEDHPISRDWLQFAPGQPER